MMMGCHCHNFVVDIIILGLHMGVYILKSQNSLFIKEEWELFPGQHIYRACLTYDILHLCSLDLF